MADESPVPLAARKGLASRKISKIDQTKNPEPLGFAGDKTPGSCNGLFSLGIPYSGSRGSCLTLSNEPASHFPHRAGHTATGRLHCLLTAYLQLPKSSTGYSLLQTSSEFPGLRPASSLQLPENSNPCGSTQPSVPVGNRAILWEKPGYCFEITPRSVSPFTKNCIARATSNNPMMRTRIRIPVSPSTLRTRLAPARTP